MRMSVSDQLELDVAELDWTYNWLVKTRQEEVDEITAATRGK